MISGRSDADKWLGRGKGDAGIYRITCIPIGWNYVGSAAHSFFERWRSHWLLLEKGIHHNCVLQQDWLRFGECDFEFAVLEIVPGAGNHFWRVRRREYYWIAQAQKAGGCYNRRLSAALCADCGSYRQGKWAVPFLCRCANQGKRKKPEQAAGTFLPADTSTR